MKAKELQFADSVGWIRERKMYIEFSWKREKYVGG
jgi:hypothetical protein